MSILQEIILLALFGLLGACSPKVDASGDKDEYSATDQSVLIIRDSEPEFVNRHLSVMHSIQNGCIKTRALWMKSQGRVYDTKSERWSDDEILELHTKHTEEYFDGPNYATLEIFRVIDNDTYNPEVGCKPRINIIKRYEIQEGECKSLIVEYNKKKIFENIIQEKNCKYGNKRKDKVYQQGAPETIEGTPYKCKWSPKEVVTPGGNIPYPKECTLTPKPIHAGTGRRLIANYYESFPFPLMRLEMPTEMIAEGEISDHQFTSVYKVKKLEIGTSIKDKFKIPDDAKGFTRVDVNKTGSDE
jgi:hypothetical protein